MLSAKRYPVIYATVIAAIGWIPVDHLSGQTVVDTTTIASIPVARDPLGVWSGNSLVTIENHSSSAPVLHVYDQTGSERQRASINIPDAQLVNIYNNGFARSADGFLAASGSAYTSDNLGAVFLVIISSDGNDQVVIRTNPFVPHAVVFGPDGTIWTAGSEMKDGHEVEYDYLIIRRFSRSGQQLGGAISRAQFSGRSHPARGSWLVASDDRVGWFSTVAGQYIEFSSDGKELATYEHQIAESIDGRASHVDGVALCADNSVWVSVETKNDARKEQWWSLESLNRTEGTWLSGKARSTVLWVYGCSGTNLATTPGDVKSIEWIAVR